MDITSLLEEVRRLPPRAAVAREVQRLRREALDGSLAIAGTPLAPPEVTALVERGLTLGAHPLDAYIVARDLAAAGAWVADQRPLRPEDARPLLVLEDVRRIHTLVAAGSPALRPGAWRLTVAVGDGGVVSPAPWLVPFETAALLDRVHARPDPARLPAWLASFVSRFARLRPFTAGNGRVARLAATLLLQRLDAPPLVIARPLAPLYRRAVRSAVTGDPSVLEQLVERAVRAACDRLVAAGSDEPLLPLRTLAARSYPALIKAARRGRLRHVVRDGRVLSTGGWIAAYAAETGRHG